MENYTSLAEVDNIFMWKLMVIVMIHGLMDGSHSTAVMLIDSRISRTVYTIIVSILSSSNDKGKPIKRVCKEFVYKMTKGLFIW